MQDTNQAAAPESWLGFKLINQAAADEMSASVLPAANSLSGRVWLALADSDGDALYVAGIVVGVTLTAAAMRYSVAFPVAPQPREGETLYAVVENVESGLVLAELPEDETVFDAVLTEDAAALIPLAKLVPVPAPVLDGVNPEREQLVERRDALASMVDGDPLAALAVASDVIYLAAQLSKQLAAPVLAAPLNDAEWKILKFDIISSMASIVGIDRGELPGMDRSLFVSSIAGKIRRQFTNGKLALAGTALAFVEHSQKAFPKPVFAPANKLWKDINWQDYAAQFVTPPELAIAIDAPAVSALTGNELGEFPDTPEGGKARREAAKDYFKNKLLGTSVFNASLNSSIEFNKGGMKKVLSFSADQRKLRLVPALPKILSDAVSTSKLAVRGDEPRVVAVHVLKADVTLDSASLTVRVIVKERDDGSIFYDHSVNKGDLGGSAEVLDSVDSTGLSLLALLCVEPSAQQVLMDSVSPSGEIFNLFIEGEAPEVVAPEDDAAQVPLANISKATMENYIKIAAETIGALRRIDVYRVLNALAADNIDGVTRSNLATYIATSRPDLAREVADVMGEEWPELGWNLVATVEPVVASGNAELEAAGFKNVAGNEWAKGVQGESGKLNLNIRVFGTPDQFKLKKSATFAGGISGSPSQEVGIYGTAAEAIAAAQDEAAAFAPAQEPSNATGNPGGLSDAEMVVLISIQGFMAKVRVAKAMEESGISKAEYDAAYKSLLAKPGFFNMGTITPEGSNIVRAFMPGVLANKKVESFKGKFGTAAAQEQNPARAADLAFLNSVISQSVDMWDDALADKIEGMGTTYGDDAEVMEVWGRAIAAYTDFMVAAMG